MNNDIYIYERRRQNYATCAMALCSPISFALIMLHQSNSVSFILPSSTSNKEKKHTFPLLSGRRMGTESADARADRDCRKRENSKRTKKKHFFFGYLGSSKFEFEIDREHIEDLDEIKTFFLFILCVSSSCRLYIYDVCVRVCVLVRVCVHVSVCPCVYMRVYDFMRTLSFNGSVQCVPI